MRGLEISEENLEDLLAYDDLFLHYFNAFLALPVFPQPLYYNRLTGTFVQVEGSQSAYSATHVEKPDTPPYGATDEERDRMLQWAKEERLPHFIKTQLFREFKLCKMLLRPLDDRCSAGRSSDRMLRGYSRQTESYVSSLSNSVDNSANDVDFDDENMEETYGFSRSSLFKYKRPGSNAYSLPIRLGLAPVSRRTTHTDSSTNNFTSTPHDTTEDSTNMHPASAENKQRRRHNMPISIPLRDDSDKKSESDSQENVADTTGQSRLTNPRLSITQRLTGSGKMGSRRSSHHTLSVDGGEHYDDIAVLDVYDAVYGEEEPVEEGEALVSFAEDAVSDQQTETDIKQLEGKHNMSLQQMKEYVLGSYHGFEEFKAFIENTSGNNLLQFWLDCENFKDMMEDYDESQINATRNRLFRDIRDRYKMNLTGDAMKHIAAVTHSIGLSHNVFIRTQYDVLRRLRAYWLLRFLIHKERSGELRTQLDPDAAQLLFEEKYLLEKEKSSFFPSINLVNSMPVKGEDIMDIALSKNWESISRWGRLMDARVKSAKVNIRDRTAQKTLKEKLSLAMTADKVAGGPFKAFLSKHDEQDLLWSLLFWEEVNDYSKEEHRAADRLLRMCHAWTIYNKFFSPHAVCPLGVTEADRQKMHSSLQHSSDFVEAEVFSEAKEKAVEGMEKAWIRFLKEDVKIFIECHVRSVDSPPSSADDIEVVMDEEGEQLIVRRARPWVSGYPPSTDTERGRRLRAALSVAESIDEARRAEQRRRAKEKRKEMERERKKAIKASKQRQRDARRKNTSSRRGPSKAEEQDAIEEEEGNASPARSASHHASPEGENASPQAEKPPTFQASLSNKNVISLFKKYLHDNEGKDATNAVHLYTDIDAYYAIAEAGGGAKGIKQKKDTQASFIFKTYMDPASRKKVNLNDTVAHRMKAEKERPKTATLKESQKFLLGQIEDQFTNFWSSQAEELGIDKGSLANMSKVELAMRSDDPALLTSWQRKKATKSGRVSAISDDKPPSRPPVDIPKVMAELKLNRNIASSVLRLASSSHAFISPKVTALKTNQSLVRTMFNESSFDVTIPVEGTRRESIVPRVITESVTASRRTSVVSYGYRLRKDEPQEPSEDPSLPVSPPLRSRHRRRKKPDGRAQPNREDKVEFLLALSQAAAGKLPQQMMYFLKYLDKHGEEDGSPLIDRDLFFYCEVQKFKDNSHSFCDDELLKRKVQSLVDVYLDSNSQPCLQIDIPGDIQQKSLRAVQKYLAGKDGSPNIFDEAQYCVFKELLPYWAGFMRSYKEPDDKSKVPMTKKQRERMKRLEEIMSWEPPRMKSIILPPLPKGSALAAFTFSLNDGLKWRNPTTGGDQQLSPSDPPLPAVVESSTFVEDFDRSASFESGPLGNSRRNSKLSDVSRTVSRLKKSGSMLSVAGGASKTPATART